MAIQSGEPIVAKDVADELNRRPRGISGFLDVGKSVNINVPWSSGFLFYGGGQATGQFSITYICSPLCQLLAGKETFIPEITFNSSDGSFIIKNTQEWMQSYIFLSSAL